MPKLASVPELVRVVRKSGLIEQRQLEDYLRRRPTLPAQPKQIVDDLMAEGLLTGFQAKHLLEGRYKGLFLDKYKLLDMIGRGAHSLVFVAEHVVLHRRVAIKVLPMQLAENQETLTRFYREARAAAVLDHPNIVRAHDINRWGQTHFLVMEYVEGLSLEEHVQKNGPVPYRQAADYASQVAAGLQHAYERGLVHRDIKPANLLLTTEGLVKILDMGLARFFEDEQDCLTQMYSKDAVLGTADYIAPEQAENSHLADIRSDIYSLGATLYRLITGRTPFGGSWIRQKIIAHQLWNPEPLHYAQPNVPEALSTLVAKMMAKKPEARFQAPQEVVEALRPWAGGQPARGPRMSPATPAGKPSRRMRWSPWAWAAAILLFSAGGAGLGWLLAHR